MVLGHGDLDGVLAHIARRRFTSEIPPDDETVAPVTRVDPVGHGPVEVAEEPIGDRTELAEVEPGVPRDHRVERPPHRGEALVERLGALRELERVPHPAVPRVRHGGDHVRVDVQARVVDTGPAEREPDEPALRLRAEHPVPAVAQGADDLAVQVLAAPRPVHDLVDPVGVFHRVEPADLDGRRCGSGASRLPRVGHARQSARHRPRTRRRPGPVSRDRASAIGSR